MSRMDETAGEDERRLSAELGELRHALRALRAPPLETATLEALRRRRASADAAVRPAARRMRAPLAVAATIAVAAIAALVGVTRHGGGSFGDGGAEVAATSAVPMALQGPSLPASATFQPLLGSAGFSPTESYSVVRVRIPIASLAPAQDSRLGGSVEADLLVGEDGLATGIRFSFADMSYVAASSN